MKPQVDLEKCTGCGTCAEVCPVEVFEIVEEKSKVVQPDECTECESCVDNCPDEAITLVD